MQVNRYSGLTKFEQGLINKINALMEKSNQDNISRTKAYEYFFSIHPEIKWAFLAGMVSRNAGWNMCDLEGELFPKVVSRSFRHVLFITYERANWLIFHDAFPQLLLYHYSTKYKASLFHLSCHFRISEFSEKEWKRFWHFRDEERLLYSLIINEQNVIEEPVIRHQFYNPFVFHSLLFNFQDWLHFSTVLFPMYSGDMYGLSVSDFRNVDSRIELGKKLSLLLFDRELFPEFYKFARFTEPTGSRHDYEKYFPDKKRRVTPFLRTTYPNITHSIHEMNQWDRKRAIKRKWSKTPALPSETRLNDWYRKKQKQLHFAIGAKDYFSMKKWRM
ncbi:DUF2515 domain-containing protein [Peribacillus cavernae]|uniref:DUF2515 domain-containing protein n=1 Tax=Peribacillus cavernae TaxID=1674310 RepID=A0A3S0VZ85_9BACI|nr:DUF2515 family protein [Peribacillus cavernae]RUQ29343.1 DUF2515 domain-containing protein [Peribacillus cavernae]